MKWITTRHLENWTPKRDCQENLPLLVRKLIRATSKSITNIKFPAGDNVALAGWDGVLVAGEATEYIPAGDSVWEFGTSDKIRAKAEEDYDKRTNNPLGVNPATTTFIFVTQVQWDAKDWIAEKMKTGIWQDIQVIDGVKLEEWLENAPTVASWLAKQHLRIFPSGGVQSTYDYWKEWSGGNILSPKIALGGRENEITKLLLSVSSNGILGVKSSSREDSLGFIISSFKNDDNKQEDFFARSIIVDNADAFRELLVIDTPLILIPRFEDYSLFNIALQNGHTVIIPLGADSANQTSNVLDLPQIERNAFVAALQEQGLSQQRAEKLSKESTRNLTILKRLMDIHNIPVWAEAANVREIIPALIAGRWNEKFDGDKEIISRLSGNTYSEYSKVLNKWRHAPDSPFYKIEQLWRVASPLDAWNYISKYLTGDDFENLKQCFFEVLQEKDPKLELKPEDRPYSNIFGKSRKYSKDLREGIVQSLILISTSDKNVDIQGGGKNWVDILVRDLLNDNDPILWQSLDRLMPLLAEASPTSFLNACERVMNESPTTFKILFGEELAETLFHQSYHTGLLWALEALAWMPEHLAKSSLLLAQLASIDPGGKLSNRPINSLVEIHKSWHYQTLANFEQRMEVIEMITGKVPSIAWGLLMRLLPQDHGVGYSTNKPRWRLFTEDLERTSTPYVEIFGQDSRIVDLLIRILDFSEENTSDLIGTSVRWSQNDREKLFAHLNLHFDKINREHNKVWHKLREMISRHRSHKKQSWALKEVFLKPYVEFYEKLKPSNEIDQNLWLFDTRLPDFIEGLERNGKSFSEQQVIVDQRRTEWLKSIFEKNGLDKIKELPQQVKEPLVLGDILGYIITEDSVIMELISEFISQGTQGMDFSRGLFYRNVQSKSTTWAFEIFKKLEENGIPSELLARLILYLAQSTELWDFLDQQSDELNTEYWNNVNPGFITSMPSEEKVRGISYLLKYKRFQTAIQLCAWHVEGLPSDFILMALSSLQNEKSSENIRIESYNITEIFENLDVRADVNENELAQREWFYMPFLNSYGSGRKPKILHRELSKNPNFFHEILEIAYSKMEIKEGEIISEEIYSRKRLAAELLDSWENIPGVDSDGNIDIEYLQNWISTVRDLCEKSGLLYWADITIGKLLAQYEQEKDKNWPPIEICEIIDSLNIDDKNRNFSTGTFNKYGSTSRGAYDGGEIEWERSKRYKSYSDAIRNKYPVTAKILDGLSGSYEREAIEMDENARKRRLEY